MRSVRLLAVVALSIGLSVPLAGIRSADTVAQAACTARWHVVAHKGVPDLGAVAPVTSTNVWAVGSGNDRPVIVHWNGTKLARQTFPWKGGSFSGVAARSGNDVWAVGGTGGAPLAVHFDGHRWQRVQLPVVKAGLADVAAVAADDVWAIGSVTTGGLDSVAIVMHWDGRRWRLVDLHGAAPRSELVSIDAASANEVWAFGYTGPWNYGYGYSPVVLRWNGGRWTQVPSGFPRGSYKDWAYGALDIAPSGDVWMGVGEQPDAGGAPPVFVRWSGPAHKARTTYDVIPSGASVFDVAGVSKDDVWAVGSSPPISHLNAKSRAWRAAQLPLASLKNATLDGISATSPTDIWAVGDKLILHYSC